ncbi:MAG: chondroitinase-B domain-containing protein, partial [Pseudomonadota bacterium]
MSRTRNAWLAVASLLLALYMPGAHAVVDIQVGDARIDPPTICCLGFSIPVSGDDNYNATATIEFREAGFTTWRPGLPLLRVRPEYTSGESPPGNYGLPVPENQFAGSLFDLAPDTQYEVRISITDPDGGDRTQTVLATTKPLPLGNPEVPRIVNVTNLTELNDAIAVAQPGDVIEIAAGTYNGSLSISNDGTLANPIVLRGEATAAVTINASGATYGVSILGDHIYLEQVTVSGSTWGARTFNTDGVVIRNSRFTNITRGIRASSGTNRNYYICDNVLEGQHVWPTVGSSTWNDEGISVTGEGHTVCYNTVSGFGDALGLQNSTSIPNIAIDFYGNDVLWTGDDGLELDFAHRNVRAFNNRISNAAMGASLQPAWGGPVYIFRNLFLNLSASAYKLNNDPSGFFIYHNTSARTLGTGNWGAYAWTSLGYTQSDGDPAYAANFEMKNNIFIGVSDPAFVTTDLILDDIDYNGWLPDGTFRFVSTWVNFADLQSNSPHEANGRILDDMTFATPLNLPAD